jgi:hypothetical protein
MTSFLNFQAVAVIQRNLLGLIKEEWRFFKSLNLYFTFNFKCKFLLNFCPYKASL